ncbi:hypothetical protein [Streptomyces bottropensis]|uniref:hypothetical protein n=1 Tax=Streptomyces bottropensis TaxID=42235 RepID=UPI0036BD0CA4
MPIKTRPSRLLALLLAAGAGIGMFAATTGSTSAALRNSDGSSTPVFFQTGSANLLSGTNSVKLEVAGASSCKAVSGSTVNTGIAILEGDGMTFTYFRDSACQGTAIDKAFITASYSGPNPKNGQFSKIEVAIARSTLFACTTDGWVDSNPAACRQS